MASPRAPTGRGNIREVGDAYPRRGLPFDQRIRIFIAKEMAFLLSRTAGNRLMMPI